MAINPETQYPGKINPSNADYPYGSARNITIPGDGTGTPWEAAIVNDLLGWQQALLSDAGVIPNGNPDKATASQYLTALKKITIGATDYVFATVAAMAAGTAINSLQVVFAVGQALKVNGENDRADQYLVVNSAADVDLGGGLWAKKLKPSILDNAAILFESKRLFNYLGASSRFNQFTIIGDSITEGSNAVDYTEDSYVAIIRKAIKERYENISYGFVNSRDLSGFGITQYHTVVVSGGFASDNFDGDYYGGTYRTSATAGHWIEFSYLGESAEIVYEILPGGGTIDVDVDGVNVGAVNTSTGTPSKNGRAEVGVTDYGEHTIRLTITGAGTVNIMGLEYYETGNRPSPYVNNVGRSSIAATQIADDILDAYSANGACILALGVNDQLLATDIPTMKAKLDQVLSAISVADGQAVICDFMFSLPSDNAYKVAIREAVADYPTFAFLDFGALWFGVEATNKFAGLLDADGVHPTEFGHQMIAETLLSTLGITASKGQLVGYEKWAKPTLLNSWVDFGGVYQTAAYKKHPDGTVELRGLIKDGTVLDGTIIFNLPEKFRPQAQVRQATISNSNAAIVEVLANGEVKVFLASATNFQLDGIRFDTK